MRLKLCTFVCGDGAPQLGVVDEDMIISISSASPDLPHSMLDLIEQWDELKETIRNASGPKLKRNAVRLVAPVPRPGKILAIGLNYADHVDESGMARPLLQTWFSKQASATNGPFDAIMLPEVSQALDYEVELVVVIGKGGRRITPEKAKDHVFGYCVGNDVSVRDWQLATSQWMIGKSFDTHAPFGPWITTADEVQDPHSLDLSCAVNGEERQRSNTRNLIFDVWHQIAHLSQAMTLQPGDLLFTGTPGGVGWAMDPPRVLKSGDIVTCTIQSLGFIENTVVEEVQGAFSKPPKVGRL